MKGNQLLTSPRSSGVKQNTYSTRSHAAVVVIPRRNGISFSVGYRRHVGHREVTCCGCEP